MQEVAQPLSPGEKAFKADHRAVDHTNLVPGVTDQEHVFNGSTKPYDNNFKNGYKPPEDVSAYDKNLTVDSNKTGLGYEKAVPFNKEEAANPAQQAAIAISLIKAGKKKGKNPGPQKEEVDLEDNMINELTTPMYKKHIAMAPGDNYVSIAKHHGENLKDVIKDLKAEHDKVSEKGYKHAFLHDKAIKALRSASKNMTFKEDVDIAEEELLDEAGRKFGTDKANKHHLIDTQHNRMLYKKSARPLGQPFKKDLQIDADKMKANFLAKGGVIKKITKEELDKLIEAEMAEQEIEIAEKELSPKQKKIAAKAGDPNKIDAADFKAFRKEEVEAIAINSVAIKNAIKAFESLNPYKTATVIAEETEEEVSVEGLSDEEQNRLNSILKDLEA